MRIRFGVLFVLFSLLAVSTFPTAPLDGTKWKLTGWMISSIDPRDVNIIMAFSGGKVSGSGGVNSYGGSYEASNDGSFTIGPISKTEMAGPEPAMRAEAAYFKLLGDARSYKIKDGTLTLYDGKGNELMSFERVKK